MQDEFNALNKFLIETANLNLRVNNFTDTRRLNLGVYTDGRLGFIKSTKAEGGLLRADDFEKLLQKLCAVIIGEEKLVFFEPNLKKQYVFLYQFDKKELQAFATFSSDESYQLGPPKCRSCGAFWPTM